MVVRWFGGTKLGKGGLVRAYGGAAREAVALCRIEERLARKAVRRDLPYGRLGAVKRWLNPPEIELLEERYADRVELRLAVAEHRCDELAAALADLGVSVEHEP